MKISYKPLWKTLIERNWSKQELKNQAGLTTNHIANMGLLNAILPNFYLLHFAFILLNAILIFP